MTRLRPALMAKGWIVAIPFFLGPLVGCEPAPKATADPQVPELLRKAATFIEAQKTFKLTVDVEMRLEAQGQKAEVKNTYLLSVARPDRLSMRLKEGENGLTLTTDGKQFLRAIPMLKKYVIGDAPASAAEVFKDPSALFLGMGIGGIFFNALLSDHVYDELTAKVTGSRDLGLEDIDEKSCRHLRFEQIDYDWDVWIETTNQPLIRKVSFEIKKFPAAAGQEIPNMKMALVYGLSDWDLDPKFPEDEFAINPREEWTKVDNLTADAAEAPHPLLGKPAPEFELEKRGGGKVELAQYRDKDVVILDFWATWCPPCVKALPTIGKVAEKYRDKGVVFYAVDLEETPDDVEQFLKDQKLDIPVLFDSDNAVAKLYQVNGIPQTVLIGKDGTVQVVHVGLKPDLENLLSGELDDLLAGKDLATAGQETPEK
jgi:thiol-disulfide isomerase/thioredoxin